MQGNKLKIIVYHHKTGKLKPAVVFLESNAYEALMTFRKVILPQIGATEEDGPFFVSFKGEKIAMPGYK